VEAPHRPDSRRLALATQDAIRQAGGEVWLAPSWDVPWVASALPETDLVICFGGDGTLIQGARLAAPLGVPIVGVNFGKMGFLAEFEPEELGSRLPNVLAGEFWVEERLTLAVELRREGRLLDRYLAINEALIARGRVNKLLRLHTWLDGQYVTTYAADGLLVSTPTGSTGSNLAAHGPVLPPDMDAVIMAPVMPFISFPNPIVLPASSRLDVQVVLTPPPPRHDAVLFVDSGTSVTVQDGDRIGITGSDVRARFARVRQRHYFHAVLVAKLQRAPIEPPLPPDTPSPDGSPGEPQIRHSE
jgi:NAD+ kinase